MRKAVLKLAIILFVIVFLSSGAEVPLIDQKSCHSILESLQGIAAVHHERNSAALLPVLERIEYLQHNVQVGMESNVSSEQSLKSSLSYNDWSCELFASTEKQHSLALLAPILSKRRKELGHYNKRLELEKEKAQYKNELRVLELYKQCIQTLNELYALQEKTAFRLEVLKQSKAFKDEVSLLVAGGVVSKNVLIDYEHWYQGKEQKVRLMQDRISYLSDLLYQIFYLKKERIADYTRYVAALSLQPLEYDIQAETLTDLIDVVDTKIEIETYENKKRNTQTLKAGTFVDFDSGATSVGIQVKYELDIKRKKEMVLPVTSPRHTNSEITEIQNSITDDDFKTYAKSLEKQMTQALHAIRCGNFSSYYMLLNRMGDLIANHDEFVSMRQNKVSNLLHSYKRLENIYAYKQQKQQQKGALSAKH